MNNLREVFKVKFIKDSKKMLNKQLTRDNMIIFGLVLYISAISIYTPRHLISLINSSIIRLMILGSIIYLGKDNFLLGLFISIALLVTINLDNTIHVTERKLEDIKEGFKSNKKKEKNDSDESDSEEEEEEESDSEDDSDEESEEESEDDDSDDDSDDDDDNKEQFDINKLKPGKNLHDNFKTLHDAIHELESFISKKEQH